MMELMCVLKLLFSNNEKYIKKLCLLYFLVFSIFGYCPVFSTSPLNINTTKPVSNVTLAEGVLNRSSNSSLTGKNNFTSNGNGTFVLNAAPRESESAAITTNVSSHSATGLSKNGHILKMPRYYINVQSNSSLTGKDNSTENDNTTVAHNASKKSESSVTGKDNSTATANATVLPIAAPKESKNSAVTSNATSHSPTVLSENIHMLEKVPNTNTTCIHTRPDGVKVKVECPKLETSNSTNISTDHSPTLNASKSDNNLKNANSTSESTEIASMNDHLHKYTGGLDVDEKRNVTNVSKDEPHKVTTNAPPAKENTTPLTDHASGKAGDTVTNMSQQMQKEDPKQPLLSTTACGIAAGLCVILAALAYVSLMIWRKLSYDNYGNREMLINENDLGDIHDEDMRHFEAACIQIET